MRVLTSSKQAMIAKPMLSDCDPIHPLFTRLAACVRAIEWTIGGAASLPTATVAAYHGVRTTRNSGGKLFEYSEGSDDACRLYAAG